MGYSADKIHGDPIAIPMTKAFQFTELLRTAEADFGHISWCNTVEVYEARLDNKYPNIVEAIMTDFGFLTTWSDDNESVLLYSWGGDKIGSSWDNVWDAIAEIVEHDVLWVMVGEDQQVWAERIINGKRVTDSVDFNQLVR